MQDCLKQQDKQTSAIAVRSKKHQDQEPCALGKLSDHPEAMLKFTIDDVLDYLIYRKEKDCIRAENLEEIQVWWFKLFKEGHVHRLQSPSMILFLA